MATEDYEVRTSTRRTRTMTAFREGGKLIVVVPEHMTARQRREMLPPLVDRFLSKEARARPPRADGELTARALELYRAYIGPQSAGPEPAIGVRWVTNMAQRWGSCTTATGEIRLSDRLQTMPNWVVDYVLLHEVAHLEEREHSVRFWELVNAHAESPRARGFLEGVDFARRHAS
ncbi:MAG TPA: M48 family metallopeptidase [Propionibacterium sp.]|nr:M48 family metallopeptidase [Propionibacterium sp.]